MFDETNPKWQKLVAEITNGVNDQSSTSAVQFKNKDQRASTDDIS